MIISEEICTLYSYYLNVWTLEEREKMTGATQAEKGGEKKTKRRPLFWKIVKTQIYGRDKTTNIEYSLSVQRSKRTLKVGLSLTPVSYRYCIRCSILY